MHVDEGAFTRRLSPRSARSFDRLVPYFVVVLACLSCIGDPFNKSKLTRHLKGEMLGI